MLAGDPATANQSAFPYLLIDIDGNAIGWFRTAYCALAAQIRAGITEAETIGYAYEPVSHLRIGSSYYRNTYVIGQNVSIQGDECRLTRKTIRYGNERETITVSRHANTFNGSHTIDRVLEIAESDADMFTESSV